MSAAAIDAGLPCGVGLPCAPQLPADITRRRLLELGGAAMLTVVIARGLPALAAAAPGAAPGVAPHWLRASYASLVGDRFRIHREGAAPLSVRLAGIRDLVAGGGARDPRRDAFALRFYSPRTPGIEQDVYRLTHPELGSFELLLVPHGLDRRGQSYEAIINRAQPRRPT